MKMQVLLILLLAISLSGCDLFTPTSTPALPTVVLGGSTPAVQEAPQFNTGGVVASGRIVPAQQAQISFVMGGNLEQLNVVVGESVQPGQVLARLAGAEQLQAALSGAELDVLTARQALEKLSDDLLEEQIAALEAVKNARDALRDAQRKMDGFGVTSEPIDIQVARSNVALAKRALDQALKNFQPYENKPENNFQRAALLNKLAEAQEQYDHAVRQLNRITGVIVPEFDMAQAKTELEIAQTTLELADARYQELSEGPDPAAVALAEARLQHALDQAEAARASLANLELKAPFAGTVSEVSVHSGEWILAGQPVLVLADLDHLRVETTDLGERDVPGVEMGQTVTVFIEALGEVTPGKVIEISPLADILGGDVVYKTMIELDTLPAGLRAGMSVEVQFSG